MVGCVKFDEKYFDFDYFKLIVVEDFEMVCCGGWGGVLGWEWLVKLIGV